MIAQEAVHSSKRMKTLYEEDVDDSFFLQLDDDILSGSTSGNISQENTIVADIDIDSGGVSQSLIEISRDSNLSHEQFCQPVLNNMNQMHKRSDWQGSYEQAGSELSCDDEQFLAPLRQQSFFSNSYADNKYRKDQEETLSEIDSIHYPATQNNSNSSRVCTTVRGHNNAHAHEGMTDMSMSSSDSEGSTCQRGQTGGPRKALIRQNDKSWINKLKPTETYTSIPQLPAAMRPKYPQSTSCQLNSRFSGTSTVSQQDNPNLQYNDGAYHPPYERKPLAMSSRSDPYSMSEMSPHHQSHRKRCAYTLNTGPIGPTIPTIDGGSVVDTPNGPIFTWDEVDSMGHLVEKSIPFKKMITNSRQSVADALKRTKKMRLL